MSYDEMNPNPYRDENPGFYFWRSVKVVAVCIAVYALFCLIILIWIKANLFEASSENLTNERCEKWLGPSLDGFQARKCIALNLDTHGVVAVGTISPDLLQRLREAQKSSQDLEAPHNYFPWHGNLIRVTSAGSGLYIVSSGTERSIGFLDSKFELAMSTARELASREQQPTKY